MGGSPIQRRRPGGTRLRAAALVTAALVAVAVAFVLVPHGSAPGQRTANRSRAETLSRMGARVGPGPVVSLLAARGYQVTLRLTPNRATRPDNVSVDLLKGGRPVDGARVRLTFRMLEMDMGELSGLLPRRAPGHYTRPAPVLGMSGHWALRLDISPPGGRRFSVDLTDQMAA